MKNFIDKFNRIILVGIGGIGRALYQNLIPRINKKKEVMIFDPDIIDDDLYYRKCDIGKHKVDAIREEHFSANMRFISRKYVSGEYTKDLETLILDCSDDIINFSPQEGSRMFKITGDIIHQNKLKVYEPFPIIGNIPTIRESSRFVLRNSMQNIRPTINTFSELLLKNKEAPCSFVGDTVLIGPSNISRGDINTRYCICKDVPKIIKEIVEKTSERTIVMTTSDGSMISSSNFDVNNCNVMIGEFFKHSSWVVIEYIYTGSKISIGISNVLSPA